MPLQAGLAGCHRFLEPAGAPELLGERGESDGRRVQLDPAFQVIQTRIVRH